MTPSALKAKATALTTRLIGAAYGHGFKPNELSEGRTVEATADLTAFVEALISVMHEASELTPGPGCMCSKCAGYRTALSRLEELAK